MFSEETDWLYRFRKAGWQVWFTPEAEVVHLGGASHGGRLYVENLRGHPPLHRQEPRRRGTPSARGGCCSGRSAFVRSSSAATAAAATARAPASSPRVTSLRSSNDRRVPPARVRDRPSCCSRASSIARALGQRSASADARLGVRRALRRLGRRLRRTRHDPPRSGDPRGIGRRRRRDRGAGGRAAATGGARGREQSRPDRLGAAGGRRRGRRPRARSSGGSKGSSPATRLFHEARVRKLVELKHLHLRSVDELVDGGLHPGYAFPLWHGFLALVAKVSGLDPSVVLHREASVLVPLACVVAWEAGVAVFGSVDGRSLRCSPPLSPSTASPRATAARYVSLALPATASRQLLVPAAIALFFTYADSGRRADLAALAVAFGAHRARPPDLRPLRGDPARAYAVIRWRDWRRSGLALAAAVVPVGLAVLWLRPVVDETLSVNPSAQVQAQTLAHYGNELVVSSVHSFRLAAEVPGRTGAVAIAALALVPLAGLAAKRRWGALRARRRRRRSRPDARPRALHPLLERRVALPVPARGGLPAVRVRVRRRPRASRAVGLGAPVRARRGRRPRAPVAGRLRLRAPARRAARLGHVVRPRRRARSRSWSGSSPPGRGRGSATASARSRRSSSCSRSRTRLPALDAAATRPTPRRSRRSSSPRFGSCRTARS